VPELRWGLTLPFAGVALADHEPLVRRAEARGFTDLWTGETNGPDGFTPLALAAAWTESMRLGTQRAPEDLIREVFVFGSPGEQRERLREFAAGGISTPILMLVAAPDQLPDLIEALAP
jgi:alkanesulfonate monooxygenase SsuD/methylene tetrahydromethanopterin reductase-like flavin-dependent oxidoreductase (luciferase family)